MMGAPCAGWLRSEELVGAGSLHGEGEGHGGEPRGAMCYFSNLSLAPASRSTALEFIPLTTRFTCTSLYCHLPELISSEPLE